MGWEIILWTKLRMWLLQEGSAGLNAKLCDQSTPQISTSHPKSLPICTLSMDGPKLWSNKTTHKSLVYFTANPRGMIAQDPKKIGIFFYYARPVDCTMLPDLNTLSEQQSSPTKNMEDAITHLLDFAATNMSSIIQYKASAMILHIDSDASYLSDPRALRCTGGHYYLSSLPTDPKNLQTSCHQQIVKSTRNAESSSMWWRLRPNQKS